MAHPARQPFTYEDYRLLPEDGKRYELIEGDLFVSPSPNTLHQTFSRRLQFELMVHIERRALGYVFNAPMDVVLEETSVVQPDLIVIAAGKRHVITKRAIEGVPDILVEILSPSSHDRDAHIKRKLYERCGVREYWVVDPVHGFVDAHRLVDARYVLRAHLDRSGTLTCEDFPELSLPLAPLFAPL